MSNKFKWIFLILAPLVISPGLSFAYRYDGGGYWNYYGSGRDYSYSEYIDTYYNPGHLSLAPMEPDYVDDADYIQTIPKNEFQPPPGQFIVKIPNKNGGYTSVIIKKSGNGFTGPQGEYYPEFPKVFQLEIMYGK